MKILIITMAIFAMFLCYIFFKEYSDEMVPSLIILLLTGICPFFLEYTTFVLSEIPYLVFSLLGLMFINRYYKDEVWLNGHLFIAILFMLLCFYTRTIGVVFLPAVLSLFLFSKPKINLFLNLKKAISTSVLFILPSSVWLIRKAILGESTYESTLLSGASKIIQNFKIYLIMTPGRLMFGNCDSVSSNLLIPVALVISITSLVGLFYCLFKNRGITEWYFLFYTAVMLSWPTTVLGRYLVPIIPFIFYYFIVGIKLILSALNLKVFPKRFTDAIFAMIISLILIVNLNSCIRFAKNQHEKDRLAGSFIGAYIEMNKWLKENSAEESVIMCRNATLTALQADRKAMWFPETLESNKIISEIEKNRVDYIIIDSLWRETQDYLVPCVNKYSSFFKEVYRTSTNKGYILKVLGTIESSG
jgi:hypothetical protein